MDAFKNVQFLRGRNKKRDKGPEKGLFGKTVDIKLMSFFQYFGNDYFPQKNDFYGNLHIKSHFFTENLNGLYGPYESLS